MGASNSNSNYTTARYDFILIPTVNLNPKLSNVLWKLKLCATANSDSGGGNLNLTIAIPKYWSMRARAVFLTRLLTPYGKRLLKVSSVLDTTLTEEWVSEPDTATLEDLERLPR